MDNEQYVREHWELVEVRHAPDQWEITLADGKKFNGKTPAQAWKRAAEYTKAMLEEIQQLEEMISRLHGEISLTPMFKDRMGLSLERDLAKLRKGMKR